MRKDIMLVCTKCHMEYEDGTPFCGNCGGNLVTKKEPQPVQEDKKKPDGKLICPNCHLLYEKLTSCIRCGAPLVTQAALKEMKKSQPPPAPSSPVPSPGKMPMAPRRGGPKPQTTDETTEELSLMEAAETDSAKVLPEDKKEKAFKLEKRKKPFFYSLHGILSVILLLMVAGYFLISYFLTGERVSPPTPGPEKTIESPEKESAATSKESSPTIPSSALPVALLPQEIQKLLDLLENVRQANLKKNINLLMSCYASDYQDWEERRRSALQSWERYNYLDLDYDLKVKSVSTDNVEASVEWRIRSIPVRGGELEEGKSVLNVIFQKEKKEWKIKEVTPAK